MDLDPLKAQISQVEAAKDLYEKEQQKLREMVRLFNEPRGLMSIVNAGMEKDIPRIKKAWNIHQKALPGERQVNVTSLASGLDNLKAKGASTEKLVAFILTSAPGISYTNKQLAKYIGGIKPQSLNPIYTKLRKKGFNIQRSHTGAEETNLVSIPAER